MRQGLAFCPFPLSTHRYKNEGILSVATDERNVRNVRNVKDVKDVKDMKDTCGDENFCSRFKSNKVLI